MQPSDANSMNMSTAAGVEHAHAEHEHGHHDEHELGFLQKYVFSVDHKVIGIQYGVTALFFLLIGFSMMLIMRWQLAFPGQPLPGVGFLRNLPLIGAALSPGLDAKGAITPDFYNALGAMHGTIMVFLGVVPLAFGAFGNFVVPLQVGAPDMAFPKLNMASYWLNFIGGVGMLGSFWLPGGAAKSGWTNYPPLSEIAHHSAVDSMVHHVFNGQTVWLFSMVFLISSSLLGSVNLITTVVQLRVKGLSWMRLPFFTWAQLVTAFLLLLAFPPLEAAAVMQLFDRLFGASFFLPSGLVVNGAQFPATGGGSPLLYQHLFWFLAHPEVYVLILPGMGILGDIIANNTRKPLFGYKALVFASLTLGFLSFVVWAHHMYLTGMGTVISSFFQTTTMLISIPSVIIVSSLVISLWGASIRFNTPMMFALAFLPMFGIGGLTGLPLGFNFSDLHLHDTYFVIGHFHYVVAPGTLMALFAGIYYWYPKATGRKLNEFWGKVHFWPTLICLNGVFLPMFAQGMAGIHRRWYDGGAGWDFAKEYLWMNVLMSVSAFCLALSQIPFILNFILSWKFGERVGRNPWEATTLEWDTPTPPPHGNFDHVPVVYRGPYEYSVPGASKDYLPQWEPPTPATDPSHPNPGPAHLHH